MSEFNTLVQAFLLGNNLHFEVSEKAPDTLFLSGTNKNSGLMGRVFQGLNTQKETIRLVVLDGHEQFSLPEEADIIIWNDCFSGYAKEKSLEERIKEKLKSRIKEKENITISTERPLGDLDPRFIGMGKDILFSKFYGEKRVEGLLEANKIQCEADGEGNPLLDEDILGIKRFIFIGEETREKGLLRREFNRCLEFFCRECGKMSQSMPIYFSSIDFWFGGMLHTQLVNRLNQDLGLFLTEDTVFYMMKLGFIIPFIEEMDYFESEGYLNPQSPFIAHLFHLCGENGAFVASSSQDGLFYEDIKEGLDLEVLQKEGVSIENTWKKIRCKPMGSRILDDEVNAEFIDPNKETPEAAVSMVSDMLTKNEQLVDKWLHLPDFPILKTFDREILLDKLAGKWMERRSYYLDIEDFHGILFAADILPEGKRTLSHVHEIVRAVMRSQILQLSDFNQIIPVSPLMGEAIILRVLLKRYEKKLSWQLFLDYEGGGQKILTLFLERLCNRKDKNILIPLAIGTHNIINTDEELPPRIIKNAWDIYISISNNAGASDFHSFPITGKYLYDQDMSHRIIKKLNFHSANMHNILFKQSVLVECSFRGCDLASAYFAGSSFVNCTFENNNLRNSDFSGSLFTGCVFEGNNYEDLILIGCFFYESCRNDFREAIEKLEGKLNIRLDGSGGTGIMDLQEQGGYDLPVLVHLLRLKNCFYSRYGFRINTDVGFHFKGHPLGAVPDDDFFDRFSYYDVYDQASGKPELFFVKPGIVCHIRGRNMKTIPVSKYRGLRIDHALKYVETDESGNTKWVTEILFHDGDAMYISHRNPDNWFSHPEKLSDQFVGKGVTALFLNYDKILAATDLGGLFLIEKDNGRWRGFDSKFHSEPIEYIFHSRFEELVFLKRGGSVIEIWDTLNDLSLWGRLVTSFRDILDIRLVESLNHAIIFGLWPDGSVGALVYNIISKHLVTYWEIIDSTTIERLEPDTLEEQYNEKTADLLKRLNERSNREVSLKTGYIRKGSPELSRVLDAAEVVSPPSLVYMEGEPVSFHWEIKSSDPDLPINKVYRNAETGSKEEFEFEIQIGDSDDSIRIPSGKLNINKTNSSLWVFWDQTYLDTGNKNAWGDHSLTLKISLIRQERSLVANDIFKIRPRNPFRGGKPISKALNTDYLYVGREEELETALDLIDEGDSFIIRGARRIGKTSFLNRIQENLPENVIAAYVSLDKFEQNKAGGEFMDHLRVKLQRLSRNQANVYAEYFSDLELDKLQVGLGFRWIVFRGLEQIKENYPRQMKKIWPKLEMLMKSGKDSDYILIELINYLIELDKSFKLLFIIDEIGHAGKVKVPLANLINPFRNICETGGLVVVLTGIPYNFDELTRKMDTKYDSGFMSYVNDKISLGPLTDADCRSLIRDNLSNRIHIDDSVVDYAIHLSAKRPEDLQFIMHDALESAVSEGEKQGKQYLTIKKHHIKKSIDFLLEKRGHTCHEIWKKISQDGGQHIREIYKGRMKNKSALTDVDCIQQVEPGLSNDDIAVFKGYGFTSPDESKLVIPSYFKEWIGRELYTINFKEEDSHHAKEN